MSSEISEVKATTLVSVIIHGANNFGRELAKTLTEQGSKVIVIDVFDKESKDHIQELKKNPNVDFVEFDGMDQLFSTLPRFDYLFYLQFTAITDGQQYSSKDFLDESNKLEKSLKVALKHKAKASIVTSLEKNKRLVEITQMEDGKPKPYSDLEIQRYTETITAEHYDKSGLNVRIIRMGSLLGNSLFGYGDPLLRQILLDAVNSDKITIKGEGLDYHYLIDVEDAVYGLLRLTFDNQTSGEVITLSYPKPLTTLSIAYKLLELDTEAKRIHFDQDSDTFVYQSQYTPAPNAEQYGWKPKHTIEQTFITTLKSLYSYNNKAWEVKKDTESKQGEKSAFSIVQNVKTPFGNIVDKIVSPIRSVLSKLPTSKKDGESGSSVRKISKKDLAIFFVVLVFMLLISFFLITPLANITYGSYRTYQLSKTAYADLQSFDLTSAASKFAEADTQIDRIKTGVSRLSWLFTITGRSELGKDTEIMVFAADYAMKGAEDMAVSLSPLAQYFEEFQPALSFGSDGNPTTTTEYRTYLQELRENRNLLIRASESLRFASAQIETITVENFPSRLQPFITELKANNREVSKLIEPFKETVYFLPEMLGVDERQRYLILLQNPGEIRSTGGWLSSYAIIGIEGGQIRQLDVSDIYDLEGLLVIQGKEYEAPQSMQNALDIKNWSMSLSNWDPDFPTASKDASFFIREAGKAFEIDGVIAMDTNVISMLLEQWGEVKVGEEQVSVTADNLQTKLIEIHNEFEPGSQRKSTFIADLANASITKILTEKDSYPIVADVLYDSLIKKHLLVNLSNSDANLFFSSQGWGGAITNAHLATPVPVEWNWGSNKANLYLEETTDLTMRFVDEDTIRYTYLLSVKNNSTTNTYPEGDYRNYHRILVPEEADLVTSEGFDQTPDEYLEGGKKVFGGFFTVASGSTNQLQLIYELKREEGGYFPLDTSGNSLSLDLLIYKQPGLAPGTYKLSIEYPDTWAVVETSDLNRGVNELTSQFTQERDLSLPLMWEYK